MTKDNDAEKPAEAHKPADAAEPPAPVDLPPENVEVAPPAGELDPFQKEKLARHEAGHTLVADAVGCGVGWTNIRPMGPGQPKEQKTHLTPSEAFLARDVAELNRDIVKIAVAGLVAEKDFDGAVGLVSDKLTVEIMLGHEAAPEPDVAHVVKYCWEGELDIDETVEATQEEVREILADRSDHFEAIVAKLMADGYVEQPELDGLLGKPVDPPAPPAPAPEEAPPG
jgi:hypothetical protein